MMMRETNLPTSQLANMASFGEECGIFGVYDHSEASALAYHGLFALQHRGQESAGIISYDSSVDRFYQRKDRGLVNRVFKPGDLGVLKGRSAIGHIRYSTTGEDNIVNIQPVMVDCVKGTIGVAHNGNLTNAAELHAELRSKGAIFQTTLDTEVILHLIASSKHKDLYDALEETLQRIDGAFSLLFITDHSLVAVRDRHGVRPLVMGRLDDSVVFASETCALDLVGAKFEREVRPGEMVIVTMKGVESRRFSEAAAELSRCIFEYIYFSRPDSILFGRSVYEVQKGLGRELARERPVPADVVIAIPDSGNAAALGYSRESGLDFEMGLVRNHYIGRTFIQNTQLAREVGVKIKLNPVRSLIEGKRLIVVDDSLVRGTTSKKIVKMLKAAGAKEVHLRISSPPYRFPCFYGVDTPSPEHLIASRMSLKEIEQYLEVDSLAYLSCEGLVRVVTGGEPKEGVHFCKACFDGDYRIPVHSLREKGKGALEKK